MTSEARPQAALAAIEGLEAQAFARAALTSPLLVLGGAVVLWFLTSALLLKLGLISAGPAPVLLGAALIGALAAWAVGRPSPRELEGPFGFVLTRSAQRLYRAVRRAGVVLIGVLAAFALLTAVARPETFPAWLPAACLGGVLGGAAGTLLAAVLPVAPDRKAGPTIMPLRLGGPGLGLVAAFGLMLAAARLHAQDATAAAQLVATLAVGAAVLPTLAVDPRRLTLRAQSPLSMTRLLAPALIRPAGTAAVAGLVAGGVVGLPLLSMVGLGLALSLLAAVARLFLTLAALGRSDRAAAAAGWVELAIAALLPTAGPAAIGPLAVLWVLFRLAWLWRRGARVRWFDAGEA